MYTSSPGLKPAFSIAAKTTVMASSLEPRFGAKPPSSPTLVDNPFPVKQLLGDEISQYPI